MKKLIFVFGICGILFACSNSETSSESRVTDQEDLSAKSQQSNVDTSIYDIGTGNTGQTTTAGNTGSQRGEELISKSDCLSCHTVDARLVGPAYQEVAEKYPATDANINMLAGKIIDGGSGNWGEIPMTPHPNLSRDDAREMVKYILSLKK